MHHDRILSLVTRCFLPKCTLRVAVNFSPEVFMCTFDFLSENQWELLGDFHADSSRRSAPNVSHVNVVYGKKTAKIQEEKLTVSVRLFMINSSKKMALYSSVSSSVGITIYAMNLPLIRLFLLTLWSHFHLELICLYLNIF